MTENSKIEWTDNTFNAWIGCTKVGPGCENCYAEKWAARFGAAEWGPGQPRKLTSAANWKLPHKWNAQAVKEGRRFRVFCASLADVFDNEVPELWRGRLWDLIKATPNLDWLLLTKRIGNAAKMLPHPSHWEGGWPNVWLGITVVNQVEADRDIPKLLATPARVRFLSMEPLLGPVDLRAWFPHHHPDNDPSHPAVRAMVKAAAEHLGGAVIDWVIVGGESGKKARPMHPDWARSLRDQCNAAGVPFLFKQWGEWGMPTDQLGALDWPYHPDHDRTHWFDARICARPIESGWSDKYHDAGAGALRPPPFDLWKTPEYLDQVARCPQEACRAAGRCTGNASRAAVTRVGKKAAGRLLDGREWNEVPV